MEKMLACAELSTEAMSLASASCTELTLVWHQCNWGYQDPRHQHDVRLHSGTAITPSKVEIQCTISDLDLPNSYF